MDIHYNAFISYRHHPDDIRVASEVHRALERFKVPRAIRKKSNQKGNMRLFRDKEELPITSNLNDDIGDALRNSDYLIVICSVHTKESIWVQREIELFLKSHDRNHVLTVLASGEPYDVIPEILLYDDVVDPVTGEITRNLVEPLSCDWRIGKRKAKREELPRLAAPLLGCAYDELRQRQRQYRMRRLITFFSIALAGALGLAAYFLHTSITIQQKNVQIQANLEQSQRNQSRHLATASGERLAEGDRMAAIALAVAALPGEMGSRPYVPEAELALTRALGVYQEIPRTLAVGAVSPGSQAVVTQFWTSPSGELLYLQDMRKHITVWNTATMEKLGEWDLSERYLDSLIPAPHELAIVEYMYDGDILECVKPDGTVLWQIENCIDAVLTEDGTTVLVIVSKDLLDYELLFLELQTGNQLRESMDLDLYSGFMTPLQFCPYPIREGMPIIIEYSEYPRSKICMFDWNTAEHKELPEELGDYPLMCLTAEGKLIAMSYGQSDVFSGVFEDNRVNSTIRRQVICVDLENSEKIWQTEIASSVSGNASVNQIPGSGRILCQSGPVFQVLDIATGQTLNRCAAGSSALTVSMGDKYAQAVLEDGYLCNYWYDENYCYEDKCLQNGLSQASIHEVYFSLQRYSNQVTIYRRTDPPVSWEYDYDYEIMILEQRIKDDQWLFMDHNCLYLFDLQTHQLRWELEISPRELLGFSRDGSKFWFLDADGGLQSVDTVTGKAAAETPSLLDLSVYDGWFSEEILYYTTNEYAASGGAQAFAHSLDLNTKETAEFELPGQTAEKDMIFYRVAGQWGQYLWLWGSEGTLWELDMTTGDLRVLQEEMTQCPAIAVKEDGTLAAITAVEQVLVMMPGGQTQSVEMEADVLAGSVHFFGSDLLVLCDNGYLYRYDEDGNLLGRTELETGDTFSRDLLKADTATSSKISWYVTEDQKLVVNAFKQGNVIDCENWKVSAVVPGYHLYWESDGSFICNGAAGIAAYPDYSWQELLQLAQEKLGGYQLTEAQKNAYGLQ